MLLISKIAECRRVFLTVLILGVGLNAVAAGPVVPGYERLRGVEGAGDVARGELLLGELNCLSCHVASDRVATRITTKVAPDLAGIGQRVSAQWLSDYLKDPHAAKPGATMPDIFHASEAKSRDGAVEFITHYLMATSGAVQSPDFDAYTQMVDQGRELFHSVGCVACHAPDGGDVPSEISVPLPNMAAKYSVRALQAFLLSPEKVRHGGRMPSFYIREDHAQRIAVYLLRDQFEGEGVSQKPKPGLRFEYFAGVNDRKLPDFSKLTPTEVGAVETVTLKLPIKLAEDHFAIRYLGAFVAPQDGRYTFNIRSDDGSRLYIDNKLVFDNDGIHGMEGGGAKADLEAGPHRFELQYFEGSGGQELEFSVKGRGVNGVAANDLFTRNDTITLKPLGYEPFVVDAAKAQMGARMFGVMGCAACHPMEDAQNMRPAKTLGKLNLNADEGCLGNAIRRGYPDYALTGEQRGDLRAALSNLDVLSKTRSPSEQVAHTLATYNCYACHERDGIGGPSDFRRVHFKVLGEMDLGDEGSVPPTLTGVGGKLNDAVLRSVLRERDHHVRGNYMATRMPKFSGKLIEGLGDAFAKADGSEADGVSPAFSEQAVADGHHLVGIKGLGCVNCHDVGDNKSLGISMVNLATVNDRLKPGWLSRFLKNPGAINVGTRMPPFWLNDTVIHKGIAGGTANAQIDAVWTYLSLGSSMPVPEGLNVGDKMVLAPVAEPIIFRTFMTGVSPRAIAVGFPESLHVAFDANVVRLAKAWRGRFFDAKGTWDGRAGKFYDPLGGEVIDLPPGPAFTILNTDDAPWPVAEMSSRNLGGKFRGYTLDAQRRPVFKYELNNIEIFEQPIPVMQPGGAIFIRRFNLHSDTDTNGLRMLAAQGDAITKNADGSWSVDDGTTIRVRSGQAVEAVIRVSEGMKQLLLSVPFENQKSSFEVEIAW